MIALCGLLILFDGYDMAMYGSVGPALLTEPGWALAPWGVGSIGSLNLVGMLLGAVLAGMAADRLGRRRVLLASVAWLSMGMLACALVPSVEGFAAARSLTGIGMGALFPLVTALVREATAGSPSARHSTVRGIRRGHAGPAGVAGSGRRAWWVADHVRAGRGGASAAAGGGGCRSRCTGSTTGGRSCNTTSRSSTRRRTTSATAPI